MYLAKVYKCRDAIYHSMNDRGVYLPDDYNADSPPAQVCLQIFNAQCSHRGKTCIKRKKMHYGNFFDFRAQKCL